MPMVAFALVPVWQLRHDTAAFTNAYAKVDLKSSKAFQFKPVKAWKTQPFSRASCRSSKAQLSSIVLEKIIPCFTTDLYMDTALPK